MKVSEFRKLIREEIRKVVTEAPAMDKKVEDLVNQLEQMAANGDIDNQAIQNIVDRLKSARRKMFTNKISPDQRKAAANKGATTKKLDKLYHKVADEILEKMGASGPADKFALMVGMHKDKNKQNKFSNELKKQFPAEAKSQGYDAAAIDVFLKNQLTQF